AAAHAAGLVHGDFKPQNVLVSDERAVVTDFGLVRSVDVDDGDDGLRKQAGTPAYMAPEQFEGGPVDARSDLFNFCAAMHEAIFGQSAFEGDCFEERRAAVVAGRFRRPPPDAHAPGWLRATLLRGLESDPERRIGSMEELLLALDRDRRRRRHILAAAGVLFLLAVGAASAALVSSRSPLAACRRRASSVTELGSSAAAARIQRAFSRARAADAAATAETVARILARYGEAWASAYAGACEATYRYGAQSLEAFDLRIGCLEARHAQVAKLVSLFEHADASVVERAVRAASELEPIESCTNPLLLRGTVAPPAASRPTIDAVRATLAEARSFELVGKYEEANQLADGALTTARGLAYPPLEAEAWLRKGFISRYRGNRADSERAFRAAFDAGERGGADRTRARAAIELVDVVGHREAKISDGDEWAQRAEAILARLGHPVEEEAALAMNRGLLDKTEGKLVEAEAELSHAYELRKNTLPSDSPLIPLSLANLATVADERGDYAKAEPMYREAVARMKTLLGPTHPDTLVVQGNLAGIAYSLGHYRDAKRQWEEVLARETERLGPEHPDVARTLYNIADAEACVGDYADAIAHAHRALSTVLAVAPEDLLVPKIELSLAIYLSAEGQPDKARPLALDALERRKTKLGDNDPSVGGAERQLARLDLDIHRPLDARAHAERALSLIERAYGETDSRLADVLDVLGTAERGLGHAVEALALHERALKIRMALGASSSDLPDTLTNIGLAELALGRSDDARARLERAEELRK
ncbi:MAG TPA: tetratricopeptide repeat-containing protein kinase family protein, partial [Polyangia bacterium]